MSKKDRERARASRSVRRISRMWLWRLFCAMLAADIVLVVIAAGSFCYKAERESDAGFSPWSRRSLTGIRTGGAFYERLDQAQYHFTTPEGASGTADAGAYASCFADSSRWSWPPRAWCSCSSWAADAEAPSG